MLPITFPCRFVVAAFAFFVSSCLVTRAQTTPPYSTDFESASGYSLGNLHNQDGWHVVAGAAAVSNTFAQSGSRSVALTLATDSAQITHSFASASGMGITFIDFFARPSVDQLLAQTTVVDAEGSRIGLVQVDSYGHLLAFDGNGSGSGRGVLTGKSVALDSYGAATAWIRLTIRQNYSTKKWDLYADGVMVAHDLGFRDDTKTYFSQFDLTSASLATGYFDYFYVGPDNPLFVDSDNDGMEDAWETVHSLSTSTNDRNSDHDSDGLTNIEEYVLGTNPNSTDTDSDGMPDAWEVANGLNPLVDDAATDPGAVGHTALYCYQHTLSPWPMAIVASGLRAWYRADNGVTKDGSNKVSQWKDVSGRNLHVTETSFTNSKPVYVADAMNSNPAIYFQPETGLATPSLVDLQGGENDLTIIAVVRPENLQYYDATILSWATNGDYVEGGLTESWQNNQFQLRWTDAGGDTAESPLLGTLPEQVQVISEIKSGSDASVWLNGALQDANTVSGSILPVPSRVAVGNALTTYFYQGFSGQIAEILVYNRALSGTERAAIESALTTKYVASNSDGDDLPDSWELQYFGTLAYGNGDDPGGVGHNLLYCYEHNLNPWPDPVVASGLRAWYRADKGLTYNGSNLVSRWADVSGHGFHLLQNTGTDLQPAVVANAFNGYPVVEFDDGKSLTTPVRADVLASASDVTVIAVIKPDGDQVWGSTIASWGRVSGEIQGLTTETTNELELHWTSSSMADVHSAHLPITSGSVQIVSAVKDGTTASVFNNGSSVGTGTVTGSVYLPPSPFSIGNATVPYFGFNGRIAEVLVYNRALTTTERQSIETALTTKYLATSADSDSDGFPDAWEMLYFGHLGVDPNADPDGDGVNNLLEYQLGRNPTKGAAADTTGAVNLRVYTPNR